MSANVSISELKTRISQGGGLALQNRFMISIAGSDFTLECESAVFPGRQVLSLDYQTYKQPVKVPYGYINEDVSLTFLVYNNYSIVRYFDAWFKSTINQNRYRLKYPGSYKRDVQIFQLSKGDKVKYENANVIPEDQIISQVTLQNAWCTTFNPLQLDNTAENSIQKFNVVLAYEDWKRTTGDAKFGTSEAIGFF